MRNRRRIFCIAISLFGLLLDASVLPFTGLNSAYVPRVCLVVIILIGSVLGSTNGMIYGALTGLLLDVTVYSPTGLVAATYTVCGLAAGFLASRSRAAWITVVPSLVALSVYEAVMISAYYLASGVFPANRMGAMGIRMLIAFVLVQILYIPFIRILKPEAVGLMYGRRRHFKKERR